MATGAMAQQLGPNQCSAVVPLHLTTSSASLAHDMWSGWGASIPHQTVSIYTDGSYDSLSAISSWAVVIADQWFDCNYHTVPLDESMIRAAHVGGAMLIGAPIACTQGVYSAELQSNSESPCDVPGLIQPAHPLRQSILTAIDRSVRETDE